MADPKTGPDSENNGTAVRPQWSAPCLIVDAITDATGTIILAGGIDAYESSSPNDGS